MALITKKISNHPDTGFEREIQVYGFRVVDSTSGVEAKDLPLGVRLPRCGVAFDYKINYYSDGVSIPLNIPIRPWRVDNSYVATVRDQDYQPIPNDKYVPKYNIVGETEQPEDWDEAVQGVFEPQPIYGDVIINEDEQYRTMPAYDYFKKLTFENAKPVSIKTLLEYYIDDNDSKNFFD